MASTKVRLPIGKEFKMVEKGDILKVMSGQEFAFVEVKRTKWLGKSQEDGKLYNIPLYAYRGSNTSYISEMTGKKDKTVAVKSMNLAKLVSCKTLFAIDGHNETFLFLGYEYKRGGKKVIKAYDLSTERIYSLDISFTLKEININKVKKEQSEKIVNG